MLRFDPWNAIARANLAGVLRKPGRLEEAEAEYRAALDAAPNLYFARTGLEYLLRVCHVVVPTAPPLREIKR